MDFTYSWVENSWSSRSKIRTCQTFEDLVIGLVCQGKVRRRAPSEAHVGSWILIKQLENYKWHFALLAFSCFEMFKLTQEWKAFTQELNTKLPLKPLSGAPVGFWNLFDQLPNSSSLVDCCSTITSFSRSNPYYQLIASTSVDLSSAFQVTNLGQTSTWSISSRSL